MHEEEAERERKTACLYECVRTTVKNCTLNMVIECALIDCIYWFWLNAIWKRREFKFHIWMKEKRRINAFFYDPSDENTILAIDELQYIIIQFNNWTINANVFFSVLTFLTSNSINDFVLLSYLFVNLNERKNTQISSINIWIERLFLSFFLRFALLFQSNLIIFNTCLCRW